MSRTVIVVEDSAQCALTLEVALQAIPGLTVNRFSNGRDAWRFLRSSAGGTVCALVTDLNMPHMSGFELIGQVRADERYRTLPILVVSGDTDPQTPERVCRVGADAFFPKPFSPAQVKKKLEQLLHAGA